MNKKEIPTQERVWDESAESWNERRKKISPFVRKFLEQFKGKLLDLGCGSGRHLIKNEDIEFYLVDFSQKMLDLAEKKAKELNVKYKIFKKDISSLDFQDNFFDGALYIATLQCLTTDEKRKSSLQELYRVLKPKAKAFIAVWNRENPEFKKRYGKKKEQLIAWNYKGKRNLRYYYFYDKDEFLEELKNVGFKILDIHDRKEDTGMLAIVEKP